MHIPIFDFPYNFPLTSYSSHSDSPGERTRDLGIRVVS